MIKRYFNTFGTIQKEDKREGSKDEDGKIENWKM